MRHIIYIFFFFLVHNSLAQTKLINHKSHSGTNKTFNPHKVNGNFGEISFEVEIHKNKKSIYSLIKDFEPGLDKVIIYTLRKKNKDNKYPYFIISTIRTKGSNTDFNKKIEKLFVQKLEELRASENK